MGRNNSLLLATGHRHLSEASGDRRAAAAAAEIARKHTDIIPPSGLLQESRRQAGVPAAEGLPML